jgi:hypothetical protein
LIKELLGYGLKALKFGVKHVDEITAVLDLSLSIPVGIGGCGVLYDSINVNWRNYTELSRQFKDISRQIEDLSVEGK